MNTMRSAVEIALMVLTTHVAALENSISQYRREASQVIPAPIVVPPSQLFEGVDGSWSTFIVRVGTPAQSMRVIASTNSQDTVVVRPQGCETRANPQGIPPNCASTRGNTFNQNASITWTEQGWHALNDDSLGGFEANLGYDFYLDYGLDKLGLGFSDSDAPVLENQTIAGYILPNPLYMGLFGLATTPVILDSYGNYSAPSTYFTALHNQNLIPSLSWSYTAGASYRSNAGIFAQLIFGGYDSSRFQSNEVSFKLSADISRDIVVGVQAITYTGDTTLDLLKDPIFAFVESTDPNIWLPLAACVLFEQAFGLEYNSTLEMYPMNTTHFNTLWRQNPSVSFRLAAGLTGGATADINLPFKAVGLTAKYPFVPDTTYYFPLKRASNQTQYTLGRTFLQESYLTVDYEKGNFSISQCTWVEGSQAQLSPIISSSYVLNQTNTGNTTSTETHSKGASKVSIGVIVGPVIAGILLIALGLGLSLWMRRRKQVSATNAPAVQPVTLDDLKKPDADKIFCTEAESEKGSMYKKTAASLYTVHSRHNQDGELAADGHEIHQLPGESRATEIGNTDVGVRHELESTLPVELAGDNKFLDPEPRQSRESSRSAGPLLSPLSHQSSVGSTTSASGLLGRRPSPLSREASGATSGPLAPFVSPLTSPTGSLRVGTRSPQPRSPV